LKDNQFFATDESFDNEEKLLEYLAKEKKSMLDSIIQGNIEQIDEIRIFPDEFGIQIFFNNNRKKEKGYFQFSSEEKYNEALNFFLSEKKFEKTTHEELRLMQNIKTLGAPLIALIFTIALFLAAQQENIRISGSRRGLKTLFANIAVTLGPAGSLIAGLIVTLILAIIAYIKVKNSKVSITSYKNKTTNNSQH
jgi:hypothetical protein